MSAKGKSKIEIEYIQDDRKRSDTLYKRRKGLVKKAHELSVICGLKISIFCTDFDKTSFSFCNDERLAVDTEELFSSINKPIWMTRFSPTDYPFKSVKGEIKEKLLFGKKVSPLSESSKTDSIKNDQDQLEAQENIPSLLTKRECFEKGCWKDSLQTTRQGSEEAEDRIEKKLKIPPIGLNLGISPTKGGGESLKINPNFKNSKLIFKDTVDDYLALSVKMMMRKLKADPRKIDALFKADPDCFNKFERFNEYILEKIKGTKFFTDYLIIKSFTCMYFSRFHTAPMHKMLSIPTKEFLSLISDFDLLDTKVDKVNEVLLHIVCDRIKPNRNFKFSIEVQKIGFCSKLYSFKTLSARKMALGKLSVKGAYSMAKMMPGKRKFDPYEVAQKNPLKAPPSIIIEEMKTRYIYCFAALHDNWLVISFNELITLWTMKKLSMGFMESFTGRDLGKLFSIMFTQNHTSKLPIFEDLQNMARVKGGLHMTSEGAEGGGMGMEIKRDSSLLNLNVGGPADFGVNPGPGMLLSDATSKLSDFSFNFFEEKSLDEDKVFNDNNLFQM